MSVYRAKVSWCAVGVGVGLFAIAQIVHGQEASEGAASPDAPEIEEAEAAPAEAAPLASGSSEARAGEVAPPPSTRTLEEITVTAERRSASIQDVPLSITAFSSEDLLEASATSVVDLGAMTPGLYLQGSGAGGGGAPTIRSQQAPEVQLSLDPAVGVYLDDVYLPRQRGNLSKLFDIERVEVLRGPQGTLFGRNTTGGAIQVVSRKPVYDLWQGDFQIAFGNYERRDYLGALNIPLVDDQLAARVAFVVSRRDGYTENITSGELLDDDKSASWRASLRWSPLDNLETLFIYDGMLFDPNGGSTRITGAVPTTDPNVPPILCVASLAAPGLDFGGVGDCVTGGQLVPAAEAQEARGPFEITSDIDGSLHLEQHGIQNNTELELDALTLRNIVAYRKLDQTSNIDVDGTDFRLLRADLEIDQWQVSEEIHLFGDAFDESLEWITGFYFFREEGSDFNGSDSFEGYLPPNLDPNPNVFDADVINTHVSIFGQATYALPFVEAVSLTAGFRYNWDWREITSRNRNALGCTLVEPDGSPADPCVGSDEATFDQPTWLVSLEWTPTDELLLYALTRRGYRAGGFNLRDLQLTDSGGFKPFKEEKVTDVEAGIKGDWEVFGRPLRSNIAGFYANYEDIQVTFLTTVGVTPVTVIQNAADADVYGGELEITLLPIDDLQLHAGLGISIARYGTFLVPDINDPGTLVDRSGERFPSAPDYMVNASARYRIPIDEIRGRELGELSIQLDYQWNSNVQISFNQGPGDIEQGPYGLFNFRLDWNEVVGSRFDLSFFIKNMLDRAYRTGGVNLFDTVGLGFESYGPRRFIGGMARYSF